MAARGDAKRAMIYDPSFTAKRRHLRFAPDPLDYALIAVDDLDGPFTPQLVAAIVEESPMGGCGLVMMATDLLKPGQRCVAKIGRLAPLAAEVVWVRQLEERVMRIGLKFLE